MTMTIKPWTITSSAIAVQDKFIKHRIDHCTNGQGKPVDTYHVLEFSDWINVIGLTDYFEVILVSEYRHGGGKVFMGLPSGTSEASDQTIEETARRELEEETAYTGGVFRKLNPVYANPAIQTNRVWTFLATGLQRRGIIHLDANEEIEVSTRDYIEFLRDVEAGEVELQGLHRAALALANFEILKSRDAVFGPLKMRLLQYWGSL